MITPETIVENEEGKKAPARKVKGLTFAEPAQPETVQHVKAETYGLSQPKSLVEKNPFTALISEIKSVSVNDLSETQNPFDIPVKDNLLVAELNPFVAPSPIGQTVVTGSPFCTSCGNPIAEHAIACMSCGAKPTGHKDFCRYCGTGINPNQIICIRCGAAVAQPNTVSVGGDQSNVGPVWMHLTWPFAPLVTLIIWAVIKGKHPQANLHGKNVLNAYFTLLLASFVLGLVVVFLAVFFNL